jgi:hypothetical protein
MSAPSPISSFDPGQVRPWWKDGSGLTEYLREVSLFLRNFRSRLRAGEHSRLPLRLIRFQLNQGTIYCDWVARDPDPWDTLLPPRIGMRHASIQALKDAIETRALLFQSVLEVDFAHVRAYRRTPGNLLELIISGDLRRHCGVARSTPSLAMRAKLLGFQFRLDDEVLIPLRITDEI